MNSLLSEYPRTLKIDLEGNNAAFLWGPRKVGKTTLLRQQFPNAKYYDLLNTDLKTRLLLHPSILREEILAQRPGVVVVDEIQKVPGLLDEVHWCLENTETKFVLCGSSARKLRKGAANLLGGRAWRFELFPLTSQEIGHLDLEHALNHGLIPKHYAQGNADRSLRSYVNDYLALEIEAEAATRNIPSFARFLEAVALTHGCLINYTNMARECGVSAKTVKEYYQILEDTLLGHTLPPWRKSKKRRLIETAKFYLFDMGIARALRGMHNIQKGTDEFGRAFEHFMIEEVRACVSYREKDLPLSFWRTSTDLEVDLVVGDMDLAVEFKSSARVDERDTRDLCALMEDQNVRQAVLVSLDPSERKLSNGIQILHWQLFCQRLWAGELLLT